jgi:hypothetical protein
MTKVMVSGYCSPKIDDWDEKRVGFDGLILNPSLGNVYGGELQLREHTSGHQQTQKKSDK